MDLNEPQHKGEKWEFMYQNTLRALLCHTVQFVYFGFDFLRLYYQGFNYYSLLS